jgi:hypothetical protein
MKKKIIVLIVSTCVIVVVVVFLIVSGFFQTPNQTWLKETPKEVYVTNYMMGAVLTPILDQEERNKALQLVKDIDFRGKNLQSYDGVAGTYSYSVTLVYSGYSVSYLIHGGAGDIAITVNEELTEYWADATTVSNLENFLREYYDNHSSELDFNRK